MRSGYFLVALPSNVPLDLAVFEFPFSSVGVAPHARTEKVNSIAFEPTISTHDSRASNDFSSTYAAT